MPVRDLLSAASGASGPANYIEDVFSTWLYTGTSASQTITNGIDLAGKGGLVWAKPRDSGATPPANANDHMWFDTARTLGRAISSNTTDAEYPASSLNGYTSSGFTLSGSSNPNRINRPYASWTFRKQPKFFDVVTYTGTGSNTTISHNLGSTPGMIIVKCTSNSTDWIVYHRSLGATMRMFLDTTDQAYANSLTWNDTAPTSTNFTVGTSGGVNGSGLTYVAYLFADNAGGFGAAGTDNVISCGSTTISGGVAEVNLGYEAQYVLIKATNANEGWVLMDIMRGMSMTDTAYMYANTSAAEANFPLCEPTATGFKLKNLTSGRTYIYMAIRRPMKVPTDATTVFNVVARNGTGAATSVTSGFAADLIIGQKLSSPAYSGVVDRLRGFSPQLSTQQTVAEVTDTTAVTAMGNTTVSFGDDSYNWGAFNQAYASPAKYAPWMFARRPGFFDEVCYTGNSTIRNLNHNLGVAPGMVIVRGRSSNTAGEDWAVWHQNGSQANGFLGARLNTTQAYGNYGQSLWQNDTTPPNMNASTISLGTNDIVNASSKTYVAYLFATCPGVSKVGSYTGTGATQTINCGFTGGARFVLIKRTDSTGDWYVWDTARGMVSGTDPSLSLNTTAAEVNANSVYTATTGFSLLASPSADVNTNGGSYIYLAIA